MRESEYVKIMVGVPVEAADAVRQAMGEAGAGVQGNYKFCSFSFSGTGRFLPMAGANPAIGAVGKPEEVAEETIMTICRKDLVGQVIAAIKKAHPYEEPAIDILPRLEVE
ncbi:hypothetical protein EPN28_01360 [Patescibacteria group bacterium]|nr:MAG: hypothetical protein EPN28_01360 [Patescibacteria group bacterium]